MIDHEVCIRFFADKFEESGGIAFCWFVVVGRPELCALQSGLADVLREFDDYAVIGVLDAGQHWCVALRGFNGGRHDLLAFGDVHGGMLAACAAN